MFLNAFTIQIKNLFAHSCFKMKHYPLPFCFGGEDKVLTVPGRSLIIAASTSFGRHQLYGMRSGNDVPGTVIKVYRFCSSDIASEKAPSQIEIIDLSPTTGKLDESGNRCLGTVSFCSLPFFYQGEQQQKS